MPNTRPPIRNAPKNQHSDRNLLKLKVKLAQFKGFRTAEVIIDTRPQPHKSKYTNNLFASLIY